MVSWLNDDSLMIVNRSMIFRKLLCMGVLMALRKRHTEKRKGEVGSLAMQACFKATKT
jgi:hypothetical protein